MYIAQVVLDIPAKIADKPYSYIVTDNSTAQIGSAVLVSFGKRKCIGFIVGLKKLNGSENFQKPVLYKPIENVLSESFFGPLAIKAAKYISENYISPLNKSLKCFTPSGAVPRLSKINGSQKITYPVKSPRCAKMLKQVKPDTKKMLNKDQKIAFKTILRTFEDKSTQTVLLDGVTGSGKTEVYLQSIEHVLNLGLNAVVLIPEISLTPQMLNRFSARFQDLVGLLHSKMSAAERLDVWKKIQAGEVRIVLGARSALFSPIENVGIYIIDEEHESSYKQESCPKYNAKDVASFLAKENNAVLVLGSATPSIESLYKAKYSQTWSYVRMKNRANNKAMPKIELVDMSSEFSLGLRSMFSVALTKAIKEEIEACHKIVLLLNQRGFSRFVLCRDCGYVPRCPHCEISLTFHENGNYLKCHHCGYSQKYTSKCPECESLYLRKFGGGTEKLEIELEQILQNRFGKEHGVELVRMDADTTKRKGSHELLLNKFMYADRAILLGTQMIAKGLDFDDVTLVGVINADTALNLPDFRAQERSFNLISQVAGRAGRSQLAGRVVVQSYKPQEPAIKYACLYDRNSFLINEIEQRRALNYPPFIRFCNILFSSSDYEICKEIIIKAHDLIKKISNNFENFELMPPVPCALVRLNKKFRFHILLKFKNIEHIKEVSRILEGLVIKNKAIGISFDIDPHSML